MKGTKCSQCHLVNFAADMSCQRCGNPLGRLAPRPSVRGNGSPIRTWVYTLIAFVLIGGSLYYVFNGFEKSLDRVSSEEADHIPKKATAEPLTHSEYEKRQTATYGDAVKNSNGLAISQEHVKDIEKLTAPSR